MQPIVNNHIPEFDDIVVEIKVVIKFTYADKASFKLLKENGLHFTMDVCCWLLENINYFV